MAVSTAPKQYTIQRRKGNRDKWVSTNHTVESTSANGALRKFGCAGAFKSKQVKVVTGSKTGRQYRAVLTSTL